jgi:hypothetical protein
MKLKYPNILPFVGCLFGISMGLSYYLGIMFSQLLIGRPSSTWILGVFWLPFFVLKPAILGFLIGSILWLLHFKFYQPRILLLKDIKMIKFSLLFIVFLSTAAGVIKITKGIWR